MSALNGAALANLASWIDDRLGNEHADRQTICEDVAGQLRSMAAALRDVGEDGADERVTAAREFLDGARRRKVTELPPSLLMRECAELRRSLGQVLDVIARQHPPALAGHYGLSPQQVRTALAALGDAAGWRDLRATSICAACAESPAELCDDHAADLDQVDAYRELARQLEDPAQPEQEHT